MNRMLVLLMKVHVTRKTWLFSCGEIPGLAFLAPVHTPEGYYLIRVNVNNIGDKIRPIMRCSIARQV